MKDVNKMKIRSVRIKLNETPTYELEKMLPNVEPWKIVGYV